jgi:hypothetical protein
LSSIGVRILIGRLTRGVTGAVYSVSRLGIEAELRKNIDDVWLSRFFIVRSRRGYLDHDFNALVRGSEQTVHALHDIPVRAFQSTLMMRTLFSRSAASSVLSDSAWISHSYANPSTAKVEVWPMLVPGPWWDSR